MAHSGHVINHQQDAPGDLGSFAIQIHFVYDAPIGVAR